jgi:hypothetical protein
VGAGGKDPKARYARQQAELHRKAAEASRIDKPFENVRLMLKAMKPDRVQWVFIGLIGVGLCLHDLGRTVHWIGIFHVLCIFAATWGVLIYGGSLVLALLTDLIELPKIVWVAYKAEKKRARDQAIQEWLELNWEHPMRPELVREYHEKFGSEP